VIAGVEIGVRDLRAAEAFYGDLLGPPADDRVRLVELPGGHAGGWLDDDRQLGVRHLAFYVGDVDAEAVRLRAAGVPLDVEPMTATGDVRLAFFRDPDGTQLELLGGPPRYHRTWSPELAKRERAALPEPGDGPRLAHLAVTVPDLDAAIADADVIGQLFLDGDGMVITFLDGLVPLELFSFPDGDVLPDPGSAELGLRAVPA
jgi:catechol 2,3-dioxygenase-like lactoylglutathione lyase family enzyme